MLGDALPFVCVFFMLAGARFEVHGDAPRSQLAERRRGNELYREGDLEGAAAQYQRALGIVECVRGASPAEQVPPRGRAPTAACNSPLSLGAARLGALI